MRKLGIFAFLILVLTTLVFAGSITNLPDTEVVNEDDQFSFTVETDLVDPVTFSDDVSEFDINPVTGIIDWTPTNDDVGTLVATITATDNTETVNGVLTINVLNTNDAPVLSNIADQDAFEDLAFTYDINADDVDTGDVLTFALTVLDAPSDSTFDVGTHFDTATGQITWTPDKDDIGFLKLKADVTDNGNPVLTDTAEFQILTNPEVCEEGIVGDLDIEIKEPDNDDDFAPGEDIDLEVDVDNDADEDLEIVVEAFIYSIEDQQEFGDAESDTIEIDEDESEEFDFELTIDDDEDLDDDDTFFLYVKAFEDGNEEDHCNFDIVEIDVKREKHDTKIKRITVNPEFANPGDTVEVSVFVENVGTKDEDEVTIRVFNRELLFDQISDEFDLEDFKDDDNNDATRTFTFTVPEDADAKAYTILAEVTFDEGDESNPGSIVFTVLESAAEEEEEPEEEVTTTVIAPAPTTTVTPTAAVTGAGVKFFPSDDTNKLLTNLLFIIGDIALIIIIIYFIKLIFFRR